jgi:hypothetical protein
MPENRPPQREPRSRERPSGEELLASGPRKPAESRRPAPPGPPETPRTRPDPGPAPASPSFARGAADLERALADRPSAPSTTPSNG